MQTPYSPTPGRTPDYCDVPIPTQECCEHPSCQQPNPPFYCTRCNSLPIDGWVPFMVLLGLVIGIFSMKKYGKTS
jgi:hypothetical protein